MLYRMIKNIVKTNIKSKPVFFFKSDTLYNVENVCLYNLYVITLFSLLEVANILQMSNQN